MDAILTIDTALRGAAGGFAILLAVLSLVPWPRGPGQWSRVLLGLGLAAYLLASAPAFDSRHSGALLAPVLVATALPAILWWAGLEFFEAATRFRAFVAPVAVLVTALAVAGFTWPEAETLRGLVVATLYLHLLYFAWQSGPGDLVEARRGVRRVLLGAGALFALAVTADELGLLAGVLGPEKFLLQSASLALLIGAFLVWFAVNRDEMLEPPPRRSQAAALSAPEQAVLDRLIAAMDDGAWATEGLTIGGLASTLNTSEHRLRRVINKGLGYRNFASFLNEHRIARARALLADPAWAETPILNLAYDVGFASVGPFNRAFRDLTGLSPSEYRAARLPKSEKSAPKPE